MLLQENQANPECSPQWCSFLLCPGHPSPLHLLPPLLAADPFPLSIVCLPRTHAKSTNGWWCGLFFVILVKRVECTFIMGVPFHEPAAEHTTTPNSFIHSSRLIRTTSFFVLLIAFCGARGPNVSHGMCLIAREREREEHAPRGSIAIDDALAQGGARDVVVGPRGGPGRLEPTALRRPTARRPSRRHVEAETSQASSHARVSPWDDPVGRAPRHRHHVLVQEPHLVRDRQQRFLDTVH